MTLAAEYTNGTKRTSAYVDINRIANGQREHVSSHGVSGKREARALAKALGATPWNF